MKNGSAAPLLCGSLGPTHRSSKYVGKLQKCRLSLYHTKMHISGLLDFAMISCFLHSYGHHLDFLMNVFCIDARKRQIIALLMPEHSSIFLHFNCVTPDCFCTAVLMEKFAKVVK